MKRIGGVGFILNGIQQDYSFMESIHSMLACCDQVHILDAGSTDGTQEVLKSINDDRLFVYLLSDQSLWNSIEGPTKLSYFQNIVMDKAQQAGMDFLLLVQADEIVHEDSIPNIRAAVEEGAADAYVFTRYNLFKDPYHFLNVPQHMKPCSTEVVRLAKSHWRSYSDGEHIKCITCRPYKTLGHLEIFHTGYVRHKRLHLLKIRHMLTEVFKMDMDKRAENCEEFEWDRFFKEEDLLPIPKALPIYVQQWAKERYPELNLNHPS